METSRDPTNVPNIAFIVLTGMFCVLFLFFCQLDPSYQHQPIMWNDMVSVALTAGFLATPSLSTLLYASSYAGSITTLNLTLSSGNDSPASLKVISLSTGCAPSPSWLTLDYPNSILYCTDEGLSTRSGAISSYKTNDDGSLVQLDSLQMLWGPVSAVVYESHGLALAQYLGSSFTTLNITDPAALTLEYNETFTLSQPGPDPTRQEAPHPHQVILDPSSGFILVPDLGSDLVRVFRIEDGLQLAAVEPLVAAPGSGPRHATFLKTEDKTFFYLVSELANTITGYEVLYNDNATLSFTELFAIGTHGDGNSVPAGAAAAEITTSPDARFLLVSSRGENSLEIPSFDPNNTTQITSDPIMSFSIDHASGNLTLVQTYPAGGRFPRQFSINKAGDLVAVGLQSDGRVVVIDRDVDTGCLKNFIANAAVEGEVTAVIFNE